MDKVITLGQTAEPTMVASLKTKSMVTVYSNMLMAVFIKEIT